MHVMRMKTPLLALWGVGLVCGVVLTLAVSLTLGVPGPARSARQQVTSRAAVTNSAAVNQAAKPVVQGAPQAVDASRGAAQSESPVGGAGSAPPARTRGAGGPK